MDYFFAVFKNPRTAPQAVAMARPAPHFMRIQSWLARIDPAANRLS
jgi:hypothetical protein